MSESKAIVFIDGNNLYHNLKASHIKPGTIHLGKLSEYMCEHFKCEHKKSVYYNSVPSIEDGEENYYAHMKFLDDIRHLPKFEVKTRKLQRYSTREKLKIVHDEVSALGLCKSCEPIVHTHWEDYLGSITAKEKGVDVQIVVDMIRSALIDADCDVCILVSGDADFIPGMDLIKQKGKKVLSACLAKGYSYDLRQKHGWFILDKKKLIEHCTKKPKIF
ncbi:MAG: NYN domain-containing protein [Candidatus Woesearchaeota archaeon]